MRSSLLATAVTVGLGLTGLTLADDTYAATNPPAVSAEQLRELQAQIAALQAQVEALQAQSDAQSEVNVTQAKAIESTAETQSKVDKLTKLVNNTSFNGRMFFDMTNINQESNGDKTSSSGTGFDVKRFYLGVDHKFNDTWSAAMTTDFQYSSSVGATEVFVKKVYLQGKFSDAFVFRVGSSDMPWIPFVEKYYGYRYVENTLVDRLKFGNSADWGVHASGNLGDMANYAASVVNGGGYKNPSRSKGVDFEGRVAFMPTDNIALAVGGYSGHLGKETETTDAEHTAERADVMLAYANKNLRIGGEYFQAKNWSNVLTAYSDKATGWSIWASVPLGSNGINAFARYDDSDTSKDIDPSLNNKYWNVGVEFPVIKGFKLAAVYKDTKNENNTTTDLHTKEFGVWGDVAF